MLQVTDNPRTLLLRLVDWDCKQPHSAKGAGERSELVCRVTFNRKREPPVLVEYLHTEYFTRPSPLMRWEHTATIVEPERAAIRLNIQCAALNELYQYMGVQIQ